MSELFTEGQPGQEEWGSPSSSRSDLPTSRKPQVATARWPLEPKRAMAAA